MDITPLVGPLVYFISTIALSLIVYILSAIYSSLYVKMFGLFPKKRFFEFWGFLAINQKFQQILSLNLDRVTWRLMIIIKQTSTH